MRPLPEPDDQSAQFWAGAGQRRLLVQRCSGCNAWRHPPRPMCPQCNSFDNAWEEVAGRGSVWSWIIVHKPVLPAFADMVPFNVVVVELEEGVRMIGNLIDVANEEIIEGMRVVVDFEEVGEDVTLPQWRRA